VKKNPCRGENKYRGPKGKGVSNIINKKIKNPE
jgi:hypothetical protein